MTKKDLVSRAAEILRENDKKKSAPAIKTTLHISDDHDNESHFKLKVPRKKYDFTVPEVEDVLDAVMEALIESVRKGEEVGLYGFGTFGVRYYPARWTNRPDTGEVVDVPARYVPKFAPGKNMKIAARVYQRSLEDGSGIINEEEIEKEFDDLGEDGEE